AVCTLRFFASPICCHPFEDDSLNYPVVTVSKGGSTILNHWLVEAVQHTNKDRREFLEQMQTHLHRFWMLTPKQMAAINRWGEHIRKRIDDFPLLDEEAFSGVTLPEFMQRNPSSRR
ncbi:hypothetical protein, partial [Pseudomonas aeruginosa]|uniref:hypothetical protein n=1 Tax=Pseudomonas aeruginosa TaxID=287 RepID=UPI0022CD2292